MSDILLQILPFFGLMATGWASVRFGVLSPAAIDHLTRFVFYFALSAMLFGLTARFSAAELFDAQFAAAYGFATALVYALSLAFTRWRRGELSAAALEAQCGVAGNTGFLAIPMMLVLFGLPAVAPVLLVVGIDLVVFGSFAVMLALLGQASPSANIPAQIARRLVKNPMLISLAAGLAWSVSGLSVPLPATKYLDLLGAAATPCALFAIGGSLYGRRGGAGADEIGISVLKLLVHPLLAAYFALSVYDIEPFAAGMMIIAAAMPVAGNVYLVAQHYRVDTRRISASILLTTLLSPLSLGAAIILVELWVI